MASFKKFFIEDAAVDPNNPLMGDDTDQEKHNDMSGVLQDELDIDDKDMQSYNNTNTFVTYKAMNYSRKWGFIAGGPVPVLTEKIVDAGKRSKYKVTFLLTQANKRKFYFPYKDGEVPIRYTGPIEDKVEYMNYYELEDLKSQGLDKANQQMPGGGMPPMGGM